MEGAPVRNELIPVRLNLNQVEKLTPTFRSDTSRIEYSANIVAHDSDGLSYCKEISLTLYRGVKE